jgi:hypothetical protein
MVTVTFAASYRLASGAWKDIAGFLERSRTLGIRVSQGSTPVLVTTPCAPGKSATGC